MTAWFVLAGALALWAVAEVGLCYLIRILKPRFQWLIGPGDESPAIDPETVRRHVERSFDPDLGWLRLPGSTGQDRTSSGPAAFHINAEGGRVNPGFDGAASLVAAVGDSFTFCRLVNDNETWPHLLSQRLNTNVLNFGVGNYGLDQALIRLERLLPQMHSHVIIMGVVPETMARVHSYWKHYFEYGNVLAFKPRFTLEKGALRHHPPAVKTPQEFFRYADRLDRIQALDPFYRTKFRRDILAFPFALRLLARFRRHGPILWHLCFGVVTGSSERGWRRAFDVVFRENARTTARLYRDPSACQLLAALVARFAQICRVGDRQPLLAVLPQPVDLARLDEKHDDYRPFFAGLSGMLPVVDCTQIFYTHPERSRLYVEGPLGPHPSRFGNQVIADTLAPVVAGLIDLAERRALQAPAPNSGR